MDYAKLSHIPDEKIKIDIADTEREIKMYQNEVDKRTDFLRELTGLLAWRKESN